MTHQELLAKLHAFEMNDCYDEICANNYRAILAVVELHHPNGVFCAGCGEYYDACNTIKAIKKEFA